MPELVRSAIDWARAEGVSFGTFLWLVAGYLILRFVLKLGKLASTHASGIWTRYDAMIKSLEKQVSDARADAAFAKAECAEREKELRDTKALLQIYRERNEFDRPH